MDFQAVISDFEGHDYMPLQYTCDGENTAPIIKWENLPQGTKSLALIVDDPDAPTGTWDHWVLFNIPPWVKSIEQSGKNLPSDIKSGRNSWGDLTYGGPCPPRGSEHRYFFKLYALDDLLGLENGASKHELETAMEEHILAKSEVVARYYRSPTE